MNTIEQIEFNNALLTSDSLMEKSNNDIKDLYKFIKEFKDIYNKERKKLPYHINLIDELRADENAHSRILVKLLQQKEPINNKYEILESFIEFIIEKHIEKPDFQKIAIRKPQITQEIKRIDLWIKENNKYAIILENKVNNAVDQLTPKGGQLQRYINITKEHKFNEEQIYVLYLPPTYEKEPDRRSWGSYFESGIYKNRYLCLSFKDDVLQWLKNRVLPNIRLKDKYLISSIEQYIDHLEGKFNLRTINNKMNMNLQDYVIEVLGLNGIEPENALKIILDKKVEMQNALNQINELEQKYIIEHFKKWEMQIKTDFPNFKIVGNWTKPDTHINLGVQICQKDVKYSLLIEYNHTNIYYGIGIHYASENKYNNLDFNEIISDNNFEIKDSWWYGWNYTSFNNGYTRLKNLIEKIELFNNGKLN